MGEGYRGEKRTMGEPALTVLSRATPNGHRMLSELHEMKWRPCLRVEWGQQAEGRATQPPPGTQGVNETGHHIPYL